MPRLAVSGQPHLVVQRGGGEPVFRDDDDHRRYLNDVHQAARSCNVAVHAYCVLADCAMLLVSPRDAADLGRFMQRVNRRYVLGFHRRHGGSGPLWAGRFAATAIEPERYLLACIVMIEQAPVRAGFVARAAQWPWSSARHHIGHRDGGASWGVTVHPCWWRLGNTPFEREARHAIELGSLLREEQVNELLRAARSGWPLGSAAFIAEAARANDRPAQPRPRGRPRQNQASGT